MFGEDDERGSVLVAATVYSPPALGVHDGAVLVDHPALVGSPIKVEENDPCIVGNASVLDLQQLARGRVADDHLLRKGRNQLPLLVGSSAEFLQEDLITVRC